MCVGKKNENKKSLFIYILIIYFAESFRGLKGSDISKGRENGAVRPLQNSI